MQDFSQVLNSLNDEQLQAVTETEGPLLVLAGAGTGKTRVLTTRIAYILSQGLAFPSQILAVTFTNKAAKEMNTRISDIVGGMSAGLWIGTFHSICLRMLRKDFLRVNLKQDFAVINQDDQLRLIKELMKTLNIDEKKYNPKGVQLQINRWKDRALLPEDVIDGDVPGQVYEVYQKRCEELNIIDFGDIILKTIILLKSNDDVLADYRRRFKYILVDEYQDTNVAQYLWLRLLALSTHNICCVGDDDQSIYGWRGAEIGNILRFEKDFDNAKIIRLETNYRSTPDILSAADAVIANNENRLGKTLRAHHPIGNKVKLVSLWDDRSEASYIADEIEAQQQIYGEKLNDMAILVRAGYQTRAFEECFIKRAIPYRILGGLRFYERLEIRDAIAYIRATVSPDNDLALERIINTPKRGLGDKTIEDLKSQARARGISLNAMIKSSLQQGGALKPKIHDTLLKLFVYFDEWAMAFEDDHVAAVERILSESGYTEMWNAEQTVEAKGRVENLKELSNALLQFENIHEFLEHVSLVSDSDDSPQDDMVSMMTIHGAKGLEFDTVFLPGWEEGLFPSQQSMDENGKVGLEEERRLAYVGITRAKKKLTISFASSRMVFGNIISSIPSRFVDELPKEHIEMNNTVSRGPSYNPRMGKFSMGSSEDEFSPTKKIYTIPSADNGYNNEQQNSLNEKYKSNFSVGERVFHDEFGYGRVIKISGRHLQIVFEKAAIKTLLDDFVVSAPKKGALN